MDKISRFLEQWAEKSPSQQKLTREILIKNIQEAKDYFAMSQTKGWRRFSDYIKTNAENSLLHMSVVVPDKENALETIVRANEGIRLVKLVDGSASKLEELEEKFRNIK